MSPHAINYNTWDIHVFLSINRLKLVIRLFLLRYTYPSKDRQSFLKTLLVTLDWELYFFLSTAAYS